MPEKFVYADNAATTRVSQSVLDAMLPYFGEEYGNPSSLHSKGRAANAALGNARARIAKLLGAKESEIYFTASGSEADNWAVKGAAYANRDRGKHIVSTKIEHHAVLNSLKALEREGFEVTLVDVDQGGRVSPEAVANAVREDTVLVSVMTANNEVGTIEPIAEISAAVKQKNRKTLIFTDAVQAAGTLMLDVHELGVDMLSLSGHKLHAPKGVGALYIRNGIRVSNLIDGGGQERSRRGGTENLPYIIGLAKALEDAIAGIDENARISAMRDRLIDGILDKIPYTRLNGAREQRLPGNVNISFDYIEGESLLLWLDMNGICASTGSACSSASLEASHVLLALGVPVESAHGSLRLSLGRDNTDDDVDYILQVLPGIVERLRNMSPLYEKVNSSKI